MRQAYDYWQDQPGSRLPIRALPPAGERTRKDRARRPATALLEEPRPAPDSFPSATLRRARRRPHPQAGPPVGTPLVLAETFPGRPANPAPLPRGAGRGRLAGAPTTPTAPVAPSDSRRWRRRARPGPQGCAVSQACPSGIRSDPTPSPARRPLSEGARAGRATAFGGLRRNTGPARADPPRWLAGRTRTVPLPLIAGRREAPTPGGTSRPPFERIVGRLLHTLPCSRHRGAKPAGASGGVAGCDGPAERRPDRHALFEACRILSVPPIERLPRLPLPPARADSVRIRSRPRYRPPPPRERHSVAFPTLPTGTPYQRVPPPPKNRHPQPAASRPTLPVAHGKLGVRRHPAPAEVGHIFRGVRWV